MKRVWRLLDMKTEEEKDKKVRSTWCCLVLHNMIIRYRQALAATADLSAETQAELDGGCMELEGVLAHVDMELGIAIKPYKEVLSTAEYAEVVGEDSSDEEVALADGGTIAMACGARGRGSKRGRRGTARGGFSKAAKRMMAVDRLVIWSQGGRF